MKPIKIFSDVFFLGKVTPIEPFFLLLRKSQVCISAGIAKNNDVNRVYFNFRSDLFKVMNNICLNELYRFFCRNIVMRFN